MYTYTHVYIYIYNLVIFGGHQVIKGDHKLANGVIITQGIIIKTFHCQDVSPLCYSVLQWVAVCCSGSSLLNASQSKLFYCQYVSLLHIHIYIYINYDIFIHTYIQIITQGVTIYIYT